MTRPGASESKKRCHDLLHRDSNKRDFLSKSTHFPDEPIISYKTVYNCCKEVSMNPFFIIVLTILIVAYLLDLIVDTLNVRHLKTDLPQEFEGCYDAEKYKKSQEYLRENTRFGMFCDTVETPITIGFFLFGGFNIVDQFSRGFGLGPVPTGLIFTATFMLAYNIFHIPFSIYGTFVIEERYGFNKTTLKTFTLDILKNWLLVLLLAQCNHISDIYRFYCSGGYYAPFQ